MLQIIFVLMLVCARGCMCGVLLSSLDEFVPKGGQAAVIPDMAAEKPRIQLELAKVGPGYLSKNDAVKTTPFYWNIITFNLFLNRNIAVCLSPFNSVYFKSKISEMEYTNTSKIRDEFGNEAVYTETVLSEASSFHKYYLPLAVKYFVRDVFKNTDFFAGAGAGRYVYNKNLDVQNYNNVSFEQFNVEKESIVPYVSVGSVIKRNGWGVVLEILLLKTYYESKGMLGVFSIGLTYPPCLLWQTRRGGRGERQAK